MELEKKVQASLFKIASEISKTKSSKRLYCLYDDAAQLYDFTTSMGLNVSLPPLIDDYIYGDINNFLDSNFLTYCRRKADKSMVSTKPLDDEICQIGEYLYKRYNTYFEPNRPLIFTTDEAFRLALGFFDYYDKDMLKHFKKMLEGGFIQTTEDKEICYNDLVETLAITTTAYSQKESYILVGGEKTIYFVMSMIHEVIHSYVDSFNYDMTCEQRLTEDFNSLYEVITFFSAYAFKNYLEEIHYDKATIDFA